MIGRTVAAIGSVTGTVLASRKIVACLTLMLLLNGLLRGFHLPNRYAYGVGLIDYSHGLTKRGLGGTLLEAAGWTGYDAFARLSTLVLLAALAGVAWACLRIIRDGGPFARAGALIYAAGYSTAYAAFLNGYHDHTGLLASVAVLAVRDRRRQLAAAAAAFLFCALLHETVFVLFFPTVWTVLLLRARREGSGTGAVLLLGAVVTAVTLVATGSSLEREPAAELAAAIENKADAPIHADALGGLLVSDTRRVRQSLDTHWSRPSVRSGMARSLPAVAPTFLLLLVAIRRRAAAGACLRALALLAPLSPLALHLVGIDLYRWNLALPTAGLLMLFGVTRNAPADRVTAPAPWALGWVVLVVLALNAKTTMPFFRDAVPSAFPYLPAWERLGSLLGL